MINITMQTSSQAQTCRNYKNCASNTKNYMSTYTLQALTQVGLALDGRIIYGPYKNSTTLWNGCDVDSCNGATVNGSYSYALTTFHPYTVGCWGPSTKTTL